MAKLGVTIPSAMDKALTEIAEQRGAPVSALVREAIHEWLEKRGKKVESKVTWGGDRRSNASEDDTNQG